MSFDVHNIGEVYMDCNCMDLWSLFKLMRRNFLIY